MAVNGPVLVCDSQVSESLLADRRANGADRLDEAWDGVYIMNPLADVEHQTLVGAISGAIMLAWDMDDLGLTLPGANVSDRESDWTKNYRVPDVLCFRHDTSAKNKGTHWFGGPEVAMEITSPGDRTLEKLGFYARVGTQEVFVLDRNPWRLTLYCVNADQTDMQAVAVNDQSNSEWIESRIVPVGLQLNIAAACLSIRHRNGKILRHLVINKPLRGLKAAP